MPRLNPSLPSPQVLHAAGIERPRAIVVAYTARQRSVLAVESLHQASSWPWADGRAWHVCRRWLAAAAALREFRLGRPALHKALPAVLPPPHGVSWLQCPPAHLPSTLLPPGVPRRAHLRAGAGHAAHCGAAGSRWEGRRLRVCKLCRGH